MYDNPDGRSLSCCFLDEGHDGEHRDADGNWNPSAPQCIPPKCNASQEDAARSSRVAPEEVAVDGIVDAKGVRFLGKAKRQEDGTYRALADVQGCLCVVEARISFEERPTHPKPGGEKR